MDQDKLLLEIETKYGSLNKPCFDFVEEEQRKDPYAAVREKVSHIANLEDLTDVNDDVCFSYRLRTANNILWLRLSMVGPYFVLTRHGSLGAHGTLVESGAQGAEPEKQIFDICVQEGLLPVDRETCERPIRMPMFKTEPGRVRIFNALFTDTDMLPWE